MKPYVLMLGICLLFACSREDRYANLRRECVMFETACESGITELQFREKVAKIKAEAQLIELTRNQRIKYETWEELIKAQLSILDGQRRISALNLGNSAYFTLRFREVLKDD